MNISHIITIVNEMSFDIFFLFLASEVADPLFQYSSIVISYYTSSGKAVSLRVLLSIEKHHLIYLRDKQQYQARTYLGNWKHNDTVINMSQSKAW